MPKLTRENAKEKLIDYLLDLKDRISDLNDFAERYAIFVDDPTVILNLSCTTDDIIGLVEDDGQGRI